MDGRSSFARPEKEAATATAAKARQATTARDPQGQVTPAQGAATGGSGHGAAASYGERDAAKQRDCGRRGTQQQHMEKGRGAGANSTRPATECCAAARTGSSRSTPSLAMAGASSSAAEQGRGDRERA